MSRNTDITLLATIQNRLNPHTTITISHPSNNDRHKTEKMFFLEHCLKEFVSYLSTIKTKTIIQDRRAQQAGINQDCRLGCLQNKPYYQLLLALTIAGATLAGVPFIPNSPLSIYNKHNLRTNIFMLIVGIGLGITSLAVLICSRQQRRQISDISPEANLSCDTNLEVYQEIVSFINDDSQQNKFSCLKRCLTTYEGHLNQLNTLSQKKSRLVVVLRKIQELSAPDVNGESTSLVAPLNLQREKGTIEREIKTLKTDLEGLYETIKDHFLPEPGAHAGAAAAAINRQP